MTIPWKEVATVGVTILSSSMMELMRRREMKKTIEHVGEKVGKQVLDTIQYRQS